MTRVARLARIGLNVSDLDALTRFYVEALGFAAEPEAAAADAACTVLGVRRARTRRLTFGAQEIELVQTDPPGAPYPAEANAADLVFQHFAIVTADIAAAHSRASAHAATPITRDGPVHLPARSGGVTAWKFRDPDGHPLELIAFPDRHGSPGIDHSAIAVADVEGSIAFYRTLGLKVASRQVNTGPEQDRLDLLQGATVDVVALSPPAATPHVELLGYRHPRGRPAAPMAPNALAATRLIFEAMPGAPELGPGPADVMRQDPDGHRLLLFYPNEERASSSR